jgi:phosphatidylinositol alpha-1,6-mannosyltransferase
MNERSFPSILLTEIFLPTKGGTAVSLDDDFRRLGGKEVHIITADVPEATEFDRAHPNTIHRLVLKRHRWLKPESAFMYAKFFLNALGLALTRRINGIFAARALPEGVTAWAVARLTGRPLLIYAHGEELTGWGRGGKFRTMCFALRRADCVLANSDFTRDTLVSLIGVDPGRIAVVYPAVDEKRFRPGLTVDDLRGALGLGASQKLILSVGRLQRRKGFDNVVRSLPALVAQGLDVHYALIGTGEDLDYLKGLISELGLEKRVHLLGHVSYEDLPRWYNACDVFAMPNRDINGDTEGFGLVFLEAASSGKPSLAGDTGGTGSAVVHGETGLRVDGERVAEVADALARLLRDTELSQAMGRQGRERVFANFTQERRLEQLRELAKGRS